MPTTRTAAGALSGLLNADTDSELTARSSSLLRKAARLGRNKNGYRVNVSAVPA
jgi:hypothetical protein